MNTGLGQFLHFVQCNSGVGQIAAFHGEFGDKTEVPLPNPVAAHKFQQNGMQRNGWLQILEFTLHHTAVPHLPRIQLAFKANFKVLAGFKHTVQGG